MAATMPSWTAIAVRTYFTGSNLFQLINLGRIARG